jgi:hypothetical protein
LRTAHRTLFAFVVVCTGLLLVQFDASAAGVTIGPGGIEAVSTRHAFKSALSGWWIGPTEIDSDLEAGFWTKNLRLPRFADLDAAFNLIEVLKIGSGFSWSGWREEFNSPGWDWTWGGAYVYEPGGPGLGSVLSGGFGAPSILGGISTDGSRIDFAFDAAPGEGSWLLLVKRFIWSGDPSDGRPRTVSISESPSPVPIPNAFWLLATGVVGIVGLRRKLQR